ncbi:MAG: tRNA (N(6)-L-threonylcarbamoyladenosine(37)-C(2))-methylthiotransferase MtaB [Bacillota bacterium]
MPTVAFHTLGCKVNQYESAAMASLFAGHGYQVVDPGTAADVCVINTCTVTGTADQKSRQAIRRAVRQNPNAIVVVTGCYAQLAPTRIADIPGVDLVIGTTGRKEIVKLVEEAKTTGGRIIRVQDYTGDCAFEEIPALFSARTRAYLKVQEGCRDFCTYCLVPYARGPLRSRLPDAVLQEAERLLATGFKELVLTGINIGNYGIDLKPPVGLHRLIQLILQLPGVARLRLSSIEPGEVVSSLGDLMANEPRFCPHLHVPLQSGDDTVLKLMGRKYRTADYRALISRLRERMPDVSVTTDVMVGFPGETDAAFANTASFIRETGFSGLHVFKFSPRPGTPAAAFPDRVHGKEKERRLRLLLQQSRNLTEAFAARFVGRMVHVLVERMNNEGFYEGFSEHYLPVVFKKPGGVTGSVIPVKITAFDKGALTGVHQI